MVNKAKVTVRDATDALKGVSTLQKENKDISVGSPLPLIAVSDGRTLTINTRHEVFPFFENDNYTLYLPELKSLPKGTTIEVKSIDRGTYKIAQRDHQIIYHNNQKTTEGSSGFLQLRYNGTGNWIQLVCIDNLTEPQRWYSFGYTGTFDTK